jgi:hypothetical protein
MTARRLIASFEASRGQALPVAIGALAIGALLITPLLAGASTDSRFTNQVGIRAIERYSMDAGVEWSGYLLISNPLLTSDTAFQPVTTFSPSPPGTVNGRTFPATQIRFVAGAGAVEAQSPVWNSGALIECYAVQSSDAGTLSARITVNSGQVRAAVISGAASCPGTSLAQPFDSSPYQADFALASAGTYKLAVETSVSATGSISLSVPAATYEVTSTIGSRSAVARLVAGYSGMRVASWQLN